MRACQKQPKRMPRDPVAVFAPRVGLVLLTCNLHVVRRLSHARRQLRQQTAQPQCKSSHSENLRGKVCNCREAYELNTAARLNASTHAAPMALNIAVCQCACASYCLCVLWASAWHIAGCVGVNVRIRVHAQSCASDLRVKPRTTQ